MAQGIGWALNEEYVYGKSGQLENASFLDYRMPVASDLPMIDELSVILGTPVWFWGVASPVRTWVLRHRAALDNVALFCTCGGAGHARALHKDVARAHPYTGTGLHLQMQEAPCDYRHGNRFEGGAPAPND